MNVHKAQIVIVTDAQCTGGIYSYIMLHGGGQPSLDTAPAFEDDFRFLKVLQCVKCGEKEMSHLIFTANTITVEQDNCTKL